MRKIHGNNILWILGATLLGLLLVFLMLFKLILPGMWNFLVVNEAPKASDVIIVLSGDTGRVKYGIELFQAGYADNILFAGGAASSMRRQAVAEGIEETRILVDNRSNSTFENAENSADIMKAHGLNTAIVVTSGYHTKRASVIFEHFFPRPDLTICAVPDGPSADNWWKDRHTFMAAVFEYLKFVWYFLFER